mgnify:CR=1 FL=1
MNKTILEKRIKERAEERFDKEFRELVNYIYTHPIGGRLKVKIGDSDIPIVNFGRNYGLFNEEGIQNKRSDNTNLQSVKMSLLKEYEKEETDEILKKLENLDYLFNCSQYE